MGRAPRCAAEARLLPRARWLSECIAAAASRACSRWGGVQEVILPVSPTGRIRPAWVQIAEVMKPDVAFTTESMSQDVRQRVSPQIGLTPLDVKHEDRPEYGAHLLAAFPSATSDVVVVAARGRALADLVGPGALAPWDDAEAWRAAGATVEVVDDDVQLALAQLEGRTVIEATAAQVSEVRATNVSTSPPVVWIYERSNFRDALWFWNMRALAPRGFRYPPMALVSLKTARSVAFREAIGQWLSARHRATTPDLVVNSLSATSREVRALARHLGLKLHSGASQIHWGRESTGPLAAATQVELRSLFLGERVAGLRSTALVGVESPRTTVRLPSAVTFRSSVGGHVMVRISGLPFVSAPQRPAVARLIHDNAVWHGGGIQLETSPHRMYQFELRAPSPADILVAALEGGPRSVTLSQPGRLAAGVLDFVTDRDVFADTLCLRVIAALTTPRTRMLVTELRRQLPRKVSDADVEALARRIGPGARQVELSLHAIASRAAASVPAVSRAVERLVRQRLVIRGLQTECERCGLKTFTALEATSPNAPCGGCGTSARYTGQGTDGEPNLHYRLNALVDRASDQGVLCHLYAWTRLQERAPEQAHVLLGADVTWAGGESGEVDLLGYADTSVFAGEAKTTAAWFTPAQIKRDISMSARLGADVHVMACLEPLANSVIQTATRTAEADGLSLWCFHPA